MNGLFSELKLALEVLKQWETLVVLVAFIAVLSLLRYVALVRRKTTGQKFGFQRRMAAAAPAPAAGQEHPEEEAHEEGEESRS